MRWLTRIAEPFSFAALEFGIYCYAIRERALAVSLFISFGYLVSKGFLLRFIREYLARSRRPEAEHFQVETNDDGITFSALGPIPSAELAVGTVACRKIGNACVCRAVRAYDWAWAKYHQNAQTQTLLVPMSSFDRSRTRKRRRRRRKTKATTKKTTMKTTQPTTAIRSE
jgi:hypothetical protein